MLPAVTLCGLFRPLIAKDVCNCSEASRNLPPSEYFPLTSQQVQMSLKDQAAVNYFQQQVQRPMLQEALKVIKDHGAEWLTFPKLLGIGADQIYQSPFWHSV